VTIILFILRKKQPKEKEDRADKKLKDVCRSFFNYLDASFPGEVQESGRPRDTYFFTHSFFKKIFQKPRQ
jgi:hypothetical protein